MESNGDINILSYHVDCYIPNWPFRISIFRHLCLMAHGYINIALRIAIAKCAGFNTIKIVNDVRRQDL